MSFSLIDICNDCGWTTGDYVAAGVLAVVLGVALGMLRYRLKG